MNLSFAAESVVSVFREAGRVSLDLFRIMIPILILVKLLQEMGWIAYLALPLNPMMKIVGLPPEMGLVWATALVNNIYGAAIVFLSLSPELSLTSAQVTVLSTMILVAHALPVEVKIAQESGNRFLFQAFIRVGGALLL
ncbi:MAG: nucleoside recognition domain-containing protein, partial [Desulfobacterales bacterium]